MKDYIRSILETIKDDQNGNVYDFSKLALADDDDSDCTSMPDLEQAATGADDDNESNESEEELLELVHVPQIDDTAMKQEAEPKEERTFWLD